VQQAQRCRRRAQADSQLHPSFLKSGPLALLLYLSEASNADYELSEYFPGLKPDLRLVRSLVREHRPDTSRLEGAERPLEMLYQQLLTSEPDTLPAPFRRCTTPDQSLAWAQAYLAQAYLAQPSFHNQRFWGIEPDEWLGLWLEPEPGL